MIDGSESPYVTVHYAQTLDGRIATRTGHSQWISCDATLELAHRLRSQHRVVMVGVGTVLADNPRLTVRLVPGRSPVRVIADSTLRLPLGAHVLTDGDASTIVATTQRAPCERRHQVARQGVEVLVVREDDRGRVDLEDLLRCLTARGLSSILIEGGSGLITSALSYRLVDRLVACIAPKVLGAGIEAVGDLNIAHMSEALQFARASFRSMGEDVIFDGEIRRD